MDYKKAGVDNELKERCSKLFYEASRKTWENRRGRVGEVRAGHDSFSGFRYFDASDLKDAVMGMGSDGIGTKQVIAERISSYTGDFLCHRGLPHDLFSMVADDAVVRGAEPILINWTINFNKPNEELAGHLACGIKEAAKMARVAVFSGETAELGDVVGGYGDARYIADATVLWIAHRDRGIDGKKVKTGDSLVAFEEGGFRSNGLTLVRKIGEKVFGEKWHEDEVDGKNLAKLALTPSRIYCAALVDMFGGYNQEPRASVHAVAHITGGGMPEKLKRVLAPSGLGARIYDQFEPPEVMRIFQKLGDVEDIEAYRTWNMGNGMIVITDSPDDVLDIAFEHGIRGRVAGEVIEEPRLLLRNKGIFNKDEYLVFDY